MPSAKEYSRGQILKKEMVFDEGWVKLNYSAHAFSRLKERLKGDVVVYPRSINISKLNIYKGYSFDGKYLHKIIVRLEFKKTEWIYLVIIPRKKFVKTLWFNAKDKYYRETRDRKAMEIFPDNME